MGFRSTVIRARKTEEIPTNSLCPILLTPSVQKFSSFRGGRSKLISLCV